MDSFDAEYTIQFRQVKNSSWAMAIFRQWPRGVAAR
jgi:hypothetical protein